MLLAMLFKEGLGTKGDKKAMGMYQKIIEINPNHVDALIALAYLYEHGDDAVIDKTEAMKLYEKVLKIEPNRLNVVDRLIMLENPQAKSAIDWFITGTTYCLGQNPRGDSVLSQSAAT